ncbi:MAG: CAP domain-containing protein, partial [Anaerolineae bacterium]
MSAIDDIPCTVTPDYIQRAAATWGTNYATYDVYPYPPENPDGKVDIRDIQLLILYFSAPCYPDGLDRLNHHRTLAQVPTVTEDRFLDLGAALHAHYMAVNRVLTHSEDPNKPAYSELGDRCGRSSNLFGGASNMPGAVDVFMGAALHRFGQLHPKLRRVGMGLEGSWAAVDIIQGVESVDWTAWPVVYPGPGQTDVPLAGSNEHDTASTCIDSVTGQSVSPPANPGYPITLQFDWFSSPSPVADNVSFARDRAPVPYVLCAPPDDAYFSMMILFPKEPLQPNQTYSVSVSGTYPAGT